MRVSFNPVNNNYNSFSFKKNEKKYNPDSILTPMEQDILEVRSLRLKTILKICVTTAIALDVIYFTSKHIFIKDPLNLFKGKDQTAANIADGVKDKFSEVVQDSLRGIVQVARDFVNGSTKKGI